MEKAILDSECKESYVKENLFIFFPKILLIYLRKREQKWGRQREREKQTPLSREPNMGLDPRTPRS